MKDNYPEGVLTEPMDPDLSEDEELAALNERLLALLAHYRLGGSSQDRWKKLAFSLAAAHVPGFQYKPSQTGRKPSRVTEDWVIFFTLSDAKNKTQAAKDLEERNPEWEMDWKYIRARYYDVLKDRGGRMERVQRLHDVLMESMKRRQALPKPGGGTQPFYERHKKRL